MPFLSKYLSSLIRGKYCSEANVHFSASIIFQFFQIFAHKQHTGLPRWLMVKNLSVMWETQIWSRGREDPLEKGMETYSSILAWRLPWTEKPGRLRPMGPQRAGHNWATNTDIHKQYTMYFQNLYTLFHIVCVLLQCLLHSILFSRFIQMNRWRSNLFPLNDGM